MVNVNNGYLSIPAATNLKGNYTTRIDITEGLIVAELGVEASTIIAGFTLALEPTVHAGSITWSCRFSGDANYAPKACR
jgi:hypothetical protein